MSNIVNLFEREINARDGELIALKNLDPKKRYRFQIRLDNGRIIYYEQEFSLEGIYEELETLKSVNIIPLLQEDNKKWH